MKDRNSSPLASSERSTATRSNNVSTMNSSSSKTTWDQDDQHLDTPSAPDQSKPLLIDCLFFWTGCLYQTEFVTSWRAHCTKHLEGMQVPSAIDCSFCHDFTATSTGSSSSWDQTLDHVLQSHEAPSQRVIVRRSGNSFRKVLGMLEMVGLSRMSRSDNLNLNGVLGAVLNFDGVDSDMFVQSSETSPVPHGITLRYQAPEAGR